MGMYTELILGCALTKDLPDICVKALNLVINAEQPDNLDEVLGFVRDYELSYLFNTSSYYFGVNRASSRFYYDPISDDYRISTRSNIKNYDGEINYFLSYLEPYIKKGSGEKDIYAYVLYEAGVFPIMYTKDGVYSAVLEDGKLILKKKE